MNLESDDSIDLADSASASVPQDDDRRPRMPEPLPVRLVAVEDMRIEAAAGLERDLDRFYVGLLEFARDDADQLVYRADNFRLIVDVLEPPIRRTDMRAIAIEVLNLLAAEHKLIEAEIEYVRQKGLHPGMASLLLQDPAGNWLELTVRREMW